MRGRRAARPGPGLVEARLEDAERVAAAQGDDHELVIEAHVTSLERDHEVGRDAGHHEDVIERLDRAPQTRARPPEPPWLECCSASRPSSEE